MILDWFGACRLDTDFSLAYQENIYILFNSQKIIKPCHRVMDLLVVGPFIEIETGYWGL